MIGDPTSMRQFPIAVFRASWDGRVLAGNDELESLLEGATGSLSDALGAANWRALTEELATSGSVRGWEAFLHVAERPPQRVAVTARVVGGADGTPEACEGVIAELESRDGSGDRLRRAFASSTVGMALLGADGLPRMVNAALCRMLGLTEAEFMESAPEIFMDPQDAADARARVAAIVAGEVDGYEVERTIRKKNGEELWVIATASVVRTERNLLDSVLVQYVDVTERHRSEQALEQSQSENRALLEAIPDLLFRVDADGYIRWWRPSRGVPLPLPPDRFLGRHVSEVHPEMAEEWLGAMARVLESGESQTVEYDLEIEGEERRFEGRVASIRGRELLVVIREITERKRLQHQLEALVQAKDELIATVSHQLRTPLTSVVGFAEEMLERWGDVEDDEAREMLGVIASQGREMADLVEDLLVAARGDVGMLVVFPARIDLGSEVRGVLGVLRYREVAVAEPDGPVVALADPFRFRQIMRNLITNAFRHGAEQVLVELARGAAGSRVRVYDDGPGLPPEEWELIFDPYYRVGPTREVPGSFGLGLSVSRMLAWLMDGDLEYRVIEGRSAFELILPAG